MQICFLRAGLIFGGIALPAGKLAAASAGSDPARVFPYGLAGLAGGLALAGLAGVWWRERRRRLRAEAQLGSANDRLRALFDESPLSICVFDPHDRTVPYRIVECNQYACDLHGWTRGELIGRGMEVLTPLPITYEGAQDFMGKLREGPRRGENPHRKKDGTVFDIEYVARRVVIDGREYMIGVDRDLTAERARRESEELNQLVLRACNDGIWDWRVTEGRIRFSDRCREMLGYTAEELPDDGVQWMALIHPEDQVAREELLRRHWEEGAPYVYQFRARHKDGNWRWLVSRGITLFDEKKRPLRMVGCRGDITEMKRIDAELLQSRKLRAVGEMVGGIAHEFNNLLTPMLLHAEMLKLERGSEPDVAGHLGPICVGMERAKELTQRILTFGRRAVDACEFLELEAVVRDNLGFLAQTIDRRIQLTVKAPKEPAVVWANRSDLNQLVINLILNARDTLREKAAKAEDWIPRIEVELATVTRASGSREESDHHTPRLWRRLTVRDNGLGISEDVRERVFEPFFTTKEVGQGTGLGLATAWHVSMALGGWIEIDSEAGEGSTFQVFLPAAAGGGESRAEERGDVTETRPPAREGAMGDAVAARKRRCVLLVEDNELVGFATQKMIESFGHDVCWVSDGLEAWKEWSKDTARYDLVLTDLNLPGISGVELVGRLRSAGGKSRVIVYSGYFSAEHEAALAELKVERLLQKPFTRAQLAPVLDE